MRTYKVTTLAGQQIQVQADAVTFGSGHVIFWNGDRDDLVWALRTDAVAEVTQERDA